MVQKPKREVEPRSGLPTAAELMQYITATPGAIGKGNIARAFGIKGADKIGLKKMLKDLSGSGQVTRQKRSFASKTRLPPVGVVEITGEDDGELTGQLVGEDGVAQGPALLIKVSEGRSPKRGERAVAKFELLPRHAGYSHQAKIMRLLPQKAGRLLGVLQLVKGHGARIAPVDKKARTEYQVMSGDEAGAMNGELVAFEIIRERGFGLPAAKVLERLGDLNDPRNISLIAINQHGIPNQFPQRVLDEAQALKVFNGSGREDFTKIPLITIDPADARDHDDAVFAEADGDGGFEVIVAIADVAHYVLPASALDREARVRGNSVYFPDLVVPMLPERISNDLCSLREGELRPALACVMHFNSAGNKTAHQFHRVAMRSAAKLSYEEAQAAIDGRRGPKTDDLLEGVLKPLWAAYRCLKKAQDKRSPLALDLPERKIILDDKGNIEKVVVPPRLDAHRLIEEFMIQANVAAAEELEKRRTPLLYRVHESPSPEKLKNLATFLRTVQREWALGQSVKPAQFNRLLESVKGEDFELLIHEIVLRTQMQATYKPDNLGHFGLALSRYAHFTSPIRRYADLIVHRALIKALGFGDDGLSVQDIEQLEDTAEMLSVAERRAMIAERETNDRLIAAWLAPQVGATFHGKISGAVGAGLFVVLDGSGADGFVPVSGLGRDYFVFDEVAHALRGRSTGETFQLGDRVEVKLLEVAPVKGGLRFEMVSAGRTGKPPRHVKKGKRR